MKVRLKFFFVLLMGVFLTSISYSAQMESATNALMDDADQAVEDAAMESDQMMNETNNEEMQGMESMNANEMNMISEEDENYATSPQGLAIVEGTSEDSELYGEIEFTETKDGLMVNAEVYNAPAGKHGIHIHENGSCEDKGNAAGGHFNPEGVQHGFLPKDGHQMAHLGDLGNIEINEEGEGSLSAVLPGVTLTEGKNSVSGKAVILHEKEDDFGQPTGNAGGRIGCGIIEVVPEE